MMKVNTLIEVLPLSIKRRPKQAQAGEGKERGEHGKRGLEDSS